MKKLLYLILFALPALIISCNDDDDLPNVDFHVGFSDAVIETGNIYIIQGDTLAIDSVTVTNNDVGKAATVTACNYYLDGNFMGRQIFSPYSWLIPTNEMTPLGRHVLTIRTNVLAVDKTPAFAILTFPMYVVADSTDIPIVTEPGPVIITNNVQLQEGE
jgi:hypothetical protein